MPFATREPIECLSKVLDGTFVACGLGIGRGLDVVFSVSFSITIMSLVLSFESWKLNNGVPTSFCHFTHLKLAFHKLINGKLCVFFMYMYSSDTRIWFLGSLWCSSLLPPHQQGAFFFHVERMKRLWHDCLSSSSPGNRTWTRCKSISLNYLHNGRNSRCHISLLCCKVKMTKRSGKF
jgi:hypothetical protein